MPETPATSQVNSSTSEQQQPGPIPSFSSDPSTAYNQPQQNRHWDCSAGGHAPYVFPTSFQEFDQQDPYSSTPSQNLGSMPSHPQPSPVYTQPYPTYRQMPQIPAGNFNAGYGPIPS
jgi:hypothetical protein